MMLKVKEVSKHHFLEIQDLYYFDMIKLRCFLSFSVYSSGFQLQ